MSTNELNVSLAAARHPAIAMLKTPRPEDSGTPGCWFGGQPTLPTEIDWPIYKYPYEPYEGFSVPMHFLAQINLQLLPRVLGLPELPPSGTIFIFFEPTIATLEPDAPKEVPCAHLGRASKVIYCAGDVSDLPERHPLPMPDFPDDIARLRFHHGDSYPRWPFDYVVVDTIAGDVEHHGPGYLDKRMRFDRQQQHALRAKIGWKRNATLRGQTIGDDVVVPVHTIFGASQEIYRHTERNLKRQSYGHFPALTSDHILLFRFAADGEIGHAFTLGDHGAGYWIKRRDLEQKNFNDVVVWKDDF